MPMPKRQRPGLSGRASLLSLSRLRKSTRNGAPTPKKISCHDPLWGGFFKSLPLLRGRSNKTHQTTKKTMKTKTTQLEIIFPIKWEELSEKVAEVKKIDDSKKYKTPRLPKYNLGG